MTEAEIYQKFGPWLRRYRGGAPAGFLAAIIQHESGGRVDAVGDAKLGERGLFQIEASFPGKVGLPADSRLVPEVNVFLGALEYQLRAIEMMPYATLGTADSWKLARLGFAIGSAGTRKVIEAATGGNVAGYRGRMFDQILSWANRTGAIAVSSGQPADKVLKRIRAVQHQWELGQRIDGAYSVPQKIPAPSGLRYTLTAKQARHLANPMAGRVLALGIVGAFVYFLFT